MRRHTYSCAVAATAAFAAAATSADSNPFHLVEFGPPQVLSAEARDMQGNAVAIDPETGFSYGGDQAAGYANGKLGTGQKDPAVCGTFSGSTCSMPHLPKPTP
jgi:hypothetical protein